MDESKCGCNPCSQINTDVICQNFSQTAMRYNDGSSTAALNAINANQHLTNQFTAQAQQQLESTNNSRMVSDILLALAAGRNVPNVPTT